MMSAGVYACSFMEEDIPEMMASCMAESDSSAESASSMRMHRKPSKVVALISQICQLRLCKMRVVSVNGVEEV